MFRKGLRIMFVGIMLGLLAIPVSAAGKDGTIQILPSCGGNPVAGGEVALYRVGDPVAGGFRLTDGFASWIVKDKDAFSDALVQWLLGHMTAEGRSLPVRRETGAVFTGLEEGLYLVVQSRAAVGYQPFRPFLMSLPQGEQWEITARPKVTGRDEIPQTGDHPAPLIGAMGLGISAAGLMILADKRNKN